ncbi:cytidine deaminase-like protein [Aspergillus floccosus]
MLPLSDRQLADGAEACLKLQRTAQDLHQKRPFTALLLGPDNTTVVMSSLSLSHVRHAECELARNAAENFAPEYLTRSTLVSTWEPCAMCAGTIYWANIGRLVYLASEKELQKVVGDGNPENLTLDFPCRTVFDRGQRKVEVIGPVAGWDAKVVEDARRYWGSASHRE